MKILVQTAAPGSLQEVLNRTSDADFLVYGVTNGGGDYVISRFACNSQILEVT
jgi:hypothetical protein